MVQETKRRTALAEAATDHVLEHGLLGLSLRPLAAAIGTSDRMLLYHFADKDDLVATVLRVANDRCVAARSSGCPIGGDVQAAVHLLWEALTTGPLEQCQRLYVEAAALGLLGQGAVRRRGPGGERGVGRRARGVPPSLRVPRLTAPTGLTSSSTPRSWGSSSTCRWTGAPPAVRQAVDDLADAVAAIANLGAAGERLRAGRRRRRPARRRARRRAARPGTAPAARLGPGRLEASCGAPARGVAQHRQQPAAALPVGAGVGLDPAGRPSYGGLPAARHRHRSLTGQAPHAGPAARQTRAPSSMTPTAHAAAVGGLAREAGRSPGPARPASRDGPGSCLAADHPRRGPAGRWCRARRGGDRRRRRRRRPRCSRRCRAGPAVRHGRQAPRRRAARRSRWQRRAGAAPAGGSRAGPRRGPPRPVRRPPGRPGSASAPSRRATPGAPGPPASAGASTSETRIPQGVASGARQGRSRACSSYQLSTRSWRTATGTEALGSAPGSVARGWMLMGLVTLTGRRAPTPRSGTDMGGAGLVTVRA